MKLWVALKERKIVILENPDAPFSLLVAMKVELAKNGYACKGGRYR